MFSSKPKFNPDKCKVQLKMLVSRIKLQISKQTNLAKAERRVVANLLKDDKEHNARIKVEQIIRADFKLESLELINNYTELLIGRFNVLVVEPQMKPEIAEAVTALVYAGYLLGTEIPELKELFNLFTAKYGKEYSEQVIQNKDKYLAHRFNKVLTSSQVPDATVVVAYLQEIAKSYGVEYVPTMSSQPPPALSATTGLVLPEPGMPMAPPPEKIDLSAIPGALPMATPQPTAGGGPSTAAMPVVAGMAIPVHDLGPAAPAGLGNVPFVVSLTKRHPEGFGLTLDSENVVTNLKSEDARGKVMVGDRVVAFNGVPVTRDKPVKMLAIDCSEGQEAEFSLQAGAARLAAPPPAQVPTPAGAAAGTGGGSADGGGLYSAYALGGLPPAIAAEPPVPEPDLPSAPPAPPMAPALGDDADDLLAARLAALKR